MTESLIRRCHGRLGLVALAAAIVLVASPVLAQNSIEFLGPFTLLDLTADGTAGAGLTTDNYYENCYWSIDTGIVELGMSSVEVLGRGGGHALISADGTRVAGTIITADSLYVTQGLWTPGEGWQELMPPMPPGGGVIDENMGSVWGMSGDGETVVGLFWRAGASDGSAHASAWTEERGVVDLGSQGRDSRAEDASYDGSVVVGWSAHATGVWQATVFENGDVTVLCDVLRGSNAEKVSPDGNMIAGQSINETLNLREAAFWLRDGDSWTEYLLGVLPGTDDDYGFASVQDMSDDGSFLVGINRLAPGLFRGFVWTVEDGMIEAMDYVEQLGLTLPEDFYIYSLTSITADGSIIGGYGTYLDEPLVRHSFLIHRDITTDVPAPSVANGLVMGPNYPNPFNPGTTIQFSLERAEDTVVEIYDTRGRMVRNLHGGALAAGDHKLYWDGRSSGGQLVSSGVYFARARTSSGLTANQRLTLVK